MPLLFDMPFEALERYEGTNPKPADFDEFWDRSIAEMHAMDSDIEIKPSDFTTPFAECSDLYFTGVDNARVHAKLIRPKNVSEPHPAIVTFHGYSGNAGDWSDKLAWAAMGFTVAAMDCRGQGGLSEDVGGVIGTTLSGHIIRGIEGPPEKMLFRNIYLDTAQLARIIMDMPDVDESRVGALGGSQGGGLTLACASLEPGIKLAAPNFPFLSDYRRTWDIDQDKDAYRELREYFRNRDPLHEREAEIFMKLGYIDIQHLCRRINAEILMAVGLMDTICPPSTQFAAYNKITSKKSLAIYPDFAHEGLPQHGDRTFQFMAGL